MHSMSSLRWAMQMHCRRCHVQGSSHDGMVLSGIRSLCLPEFINVKHLVVGWAYSVFAIACVCYMGISVACLLSGECGS